MEEHRKKATDIEKGTENSEGEDGMENKKVGKTKEKMEKTKAKVKRNDRITKGFQ